MAPVRVIWKKWRKRNSHAGSGGSSPMDVCPIIAFADWALTIVVVVVVNSVNDPNLNSRTLTTHVFRSLVQRTNSFAPLHRMQSNVAFCKGKQPISIVHHVLKWPILTIWAEIFRNYRKQYWHEPECTKFHQTIWWIVTCGPSTKNSRNTTVG